MFTGERISCSLSTFMLSMITKMNLESFDDIFFVIQFENAGCLHHSIGKGRCILLVCSQEHDCLKVCVHLLLKMITTMDVESFVGTSSVIQIEF